MKDDIFLLYPCSKMGGFEIALLYSYFPLFLNKTSITLVSELGRCNVTFGSAVAQW